MNTPMWTVATCLQYARNGLRFTSDLTDAEWAVLGPPLPPPAEAKRPPEWPIQEIVNAIFYALRNGIPRRILPPTFPPRQIVYGWLADWREAGVWQSINHHLVMLDREGIEHKASPNAAVLDSQSVKTTEAGGPCGYDAGKKVLGRKRHALVGTKGRTLGLEVGTDTVHDANGAVALLKESRRRFPFVALAFGNTAYVAVRVSDATCVAVEIVRKIPGHVGLKKHSRRWVVERYFAHLGQSRSLAKDYEAINESAGAFLYAASAMLLVQHLARCT